MIFKSVSSFNIFDHPVVLSVASIALILLLILYQNARDGQIRVKWIAACEEMGGEAHLDSDKRNIVNAKCLKPNSIITVPFYEKN